MLIVLTISFDEVAAEVMAYCCHRDSNLRRVFQEPENGKFQEVIQCVHSTYGLRVADAELARQEVMVLSKEPGQVGD